MAKKPQKWPLFGPALKRSMDQCGIRTEDQLAALMRDQGYEKTTKGMVSKWLNGDRPNPDRVQALEDGLRTKAGYLQVLAGYKVGEHTYVHDGVIVEEVLRHHKELRKVALNWASRLQFPPADLLGVADGAGPLIERIVFDGLPYAGFSPDVVTHQEIDVEDTVKFEQLKEHLSGDWVWEGYDEWKDLAASLKKDCDMLFEVVCLHTNEQVEKALEKFRSSHPELSQQLKSILLLGDLQRRWGPFVRTLRGLDVPVNLRAFFNANTCAPVSVGDEELEVAFFDPADRNKSDRPEYKRMIEDKMADFFGIRRALCCISLPGDVLRSWGSLGVMMDRFANSVYQQAVRMKKRGASMARRQVAKYRIEVDEKVGLSRLFANNEELACLPQ